MRRGGTALGFTGWKVGIVRKKVGEEVDDGSGDGNSVGWGISMDG